MCLTQQVVRVLDTLIFTSHWHGRTTAYIDTSSERKRLLIRILGSARLCFGGLQEIPTARCGAVIRSIPARGLEAVAMSVRGRTLEQSRFS